MNKHIGGQRNWLHVNPGFMGIRCLGWQIDWRTHLPFSLRVGIPSGWTTGWRVWKVGKGWITIGRVK